MHILGRATATLCVGVALAALLHAEASDPQALYNAALARERLLRRELDTIRPAQDATQLLSRVRILVGSYEDLARLFPTSGYGDNALWQGAQLSADAFWERGDAGDRAAALRLFEKLTSRFSTSSLARQATAEVKRLVAAMPQPALAPPVPQRSPSVIAAPVSVTSNTRPILLSAIRRELLPDVLRIILELEREAPFSSERIDGPPRVFVDLQNTRASEALRDALLPYSDGVVKQIRVGRQLQARTRVVFDLQGAARHSVYSLYNPYRIVIDFDRPTQQDAWRATALPPLTPSPASPVPIPATAPRVETMREGSTQPASVPNRAGATAPRPPAANRGGGFSLSRQLGLGIARIVIDPGHGGHDPGAKAQGLTEAEIVLDVSLRLEKLLLSEPGVEVVLTRRTNAYVSLEDRTDIANRSDADLFLSIHANASANARASGVETYFLNFAPNAAAESVAARENAASARTMRNLPDLVKAIALNNKLDESRAFATTVQTTLYDRVRQVNRGAKNLGVKQAPFMVLVGATMPSVLAEIAFMTNALESGLLKTEKYRQHIAEALLAGLQRYQQSLKKAPAIAAQ